MPIYNIVTEELWKMRVEYSVKADSSEDAVKKIRAGSVGYECKDNLEQDEVTQIVSIEEE